MHLPVFLTVTTGMRRSEVLGLRWRDVDLDAGTLSVTQVLEQTSDGLNFQSPKTARSRRSIDLLPETIDILRSHKARQAEKLLRCGVRQGGDGLVVCRADGEPIQPRSLTHEFARLIKQTGVRRIRFHDLRHTHLTHCLMAGMHPKIASERAGHSNISITLDVYSHVLPGMQKDAVAKLDTFLRTSTERQ